MFSGATSAKQNDDPIHQLQETNDIKWIVIDGNIVHDATNSYFEQIRQPNGDIYLRLVDIFKGTKNRTAGSYQTNPVDDSADNLPNYQNHEF
jgi:hypothetical protein